MRKLCRTRLLASLDTSSPSFLASTLETVQESGATGSDLAWSTPFPIDRPLFCQQVAWRWSCDQVAANETWEASPYPSYRGKAVWEEEVGDSDLEIIKGKARQSWRSWPWNYQPQRFLRRQMKKAVIQATHSHSVSYRASWFITSWKQTDWAPDSSLTHKIKSRQIRHLRKCWGGVPGWFRGLNIRPFIST